MVSVEYAVKFRSTLRLGGIDRAAHYTCVCVGLCVCLCICLSKRHEHMSPRDRVNVSYERMASSIGSRFRTQDLSIAKVLFVTYSGAKRAFTHDPSIKNGLVPAEMCHTLGTTASQGYSTWPLTPDTGVQKLVVYGRDMMACLRAVGAGQMPIMTALVGFVPRHSVTDTPTSTSTSLQEGPTKVLALFPGCATHKTSLCGGKSQSSKNIHLKTFLKEWIMYIPSVWGGISTWAPGQLRS